MVGATVTVLTSRCSWSRAWQPHSAQMAAMHQVLLVYHSLAGAVAKYMYRIGTTWRKLWRTAARLRVWQRDDKKAPLPPSLPFLDIVAYIGTDTAKERLHPHPLCYSESARVAFLSLSACVCVCVCVCVCE